MRGRKRLLGRVLLAELQREPDVAAMLGPQHRRVLLDRCAHVDNRRERLPFDSDGLCSVTRLLDRVGDHERDFLADMQNLVFRQHVIRRHPDLWPAVHVEDQRTKARERGKPRHIRVGEDEADARHLAGGLKVRELEICMAMRRAHEYGAQRTFRDQVGDEAPLPSDKRRILQPKVGLADTELEWTHVLSPAVCCRQILHVIRNENAAGLPFRVGKLPKGCCRLIGQSDVVLCHGSRRGG